jgi:hypothetical protein
MPCMRVPEADLKTKTMPWRREIRSTDGPAPPSAQFVARYRKMHACKLGVLSYHGQEWKLEGNNASDPSNEALYRKKTSLGYRSKQNYQSPPKWAWVHAGDPNPCSNPVAFYYCASDLADAAGPAVDRMGVARSFVQTVGSDCVTAG